MADTMISIQIWAPCCGNPLELRVPKLLSGAQQIKVSTHCEIPLTIMVTGDGKGQHWIMITDRNLRDYNFPTKG